MQNENFQEKQYFKQWKMYEVSFKFKASILLPSVSSYIVIYFSRKFLIAFKNALNSVRTIALTRPMLFFEKNKACMIFSVPASSCCRFFCTFFAWI